MYKITWDKETGGVQLNFKVVEDSLSIPPRPVFWEELDLLKLNESGWSYPHCEEPLMWAVNKQYFYFGELLFEAKGANMYDDATIVLAEGIKPSRLKAVNMNKMLDRNKEIMFLLESEAIEFIRDIYTSYASARKSVESCNANKIDFESLAKDLEKKTKKKMAIVKEDCDSFDIMPMDVAQKEGKKTYLTTKIDKFIASFSGGKDSQVVLDLCTRAIPSTDFEVVYSDTGYELPSSLELYEQVQDYYKRKFPDLKFSLTKNHESVLNYWDKIGTPSDSHRWCCSVMKTAPLYRSLKIEGTNKQAKVLAFEGVRAEESVKRSGYQRIGKGVKHSFVVNARPILNWNTTETFLYLFSYRLPINPAYRYGKTRVGCVLCPFSSPWDDMIVNKKYTAKLKPFLSRIEEIAKNRNIPNLDEYIKDRRWRTRASGNYMGIKTTVVFKQDLPEFSAKITNAEYDIETWLFVLGKFTMNRQGKRATGELKFNKNIYQFDIAYKTERDYTFTLHNLIDSYLLKYVKRIIFKSAYCQQCEVCEIECPTGALSVYPKIKIDKDKCIHCCQCLNFHDHGCIVANSLTTNMESKEKSGSISKYGTFGIHEEWIDEFLANPTDFWNFNILGKKQVTSFKAWLKDAEIVDSKNNLTEFGQFCSDNYINERDLIWEIIWVNICYNSTLVEWYINTIKPNQMYDEKLLDEFGIEHFKGEYSQNTIEYALDGLMQVFKYSPIGSTLCQGSIEGKYHKRSAYEGISDAGFAYAIYKYSESYNVKSIRVSDFYDEECHNGVYRQFCLTRSSIEKLFRNLDSVGILTAELNMGLDNITLKEQTSIGVLKELVK